MLQDESEDWEGRIFLGFVYIKPYSDLNLI